MGIFKHRINTYSYIGYEFQHGITNDHYIVTGVIRDLRKRTTRIYCKNINTGFKEIFTPFMFNKYLKNNLV